MKAVIIGAGAQGRVALDLINSNQEFNEIEFLDDDASKWNTCLNGVKIAGPISSLESYDKNNFRALIALGNPIARKKVAHRLDQIGAPLMNLIHNSAYIASSVSLGEGNTFCAQAIINSNAEIKSHVLVNNIAVVEHDSLLNNYTTVCPGAQIGGRVDLAEGAFICTGAIVLPRLKIGEYSVLAAGSVLTKDLPDHVLAMGAPARIVREIGPDYDWQSLL